MKKEYFLFKPASNERFYLGAGRGDLLFPESKSGDEKSFGLNKVMSSIKILTEKIHKDYQLRPGYFDKLDDDYVNKVANDIGNWCVPRGGRPGSKGNPEIQLGEINEFESKSKDTSTKRERLNKYPFTGTRFYV